MLELESLYLRLDRDEIVIIVDYGSYQGVKKLFVLLTHRWINDSLLVALTKPDPSRLRDRSNRLGLNSCFLTISGCLV
jgi:hypothetical protein